MERKVVFQPSIFSDYVSFREGKISETCEYMVPLVTFWNTNMELKMDSLQRRFPFVQGVF